MIAFSDLTEAQKQRWEDYLVERGFMTGPGLLMTERRQALDRSKLRLSGLPHGQLAFRQPWTKTTDYGVGIVDVQGDNSSMIAGMFHHWKAFLAAEGLLESQRMP